MKTFNEYLIIFLLILNLVIVILIGGWRTFSVVDEKSVVDKDCNNQLIELNVSWLKLFNSIK